MALLTFKGGVHPYDGKELSKDRPITPCPPKGDLIYPLSQHIGAPALPVVKKGDGCWQDRKSRRRGDSYLRPCMLLYPELLKVLSLI